MRKLMIVPLGLLLLNVPYLPAATKKGGKVEQGAAKKNAGAATAEKAKQQGSEKAAEKAAEKSKAAKK